MVFLLSFSLSLAAENTKKSRGFLRRVGMLAILILSGLLALFFLIMFAYSWLMKQSKTKDELEDTSRHPDLQFFHPTAIIAAADNFSLVNKLGEGGFGSVYKGELSNEQKIAVKRLAKSSRQGSEEFKNEIVLIAKLQHRNLVKLLGCCIQGEEMMLVYEYSPNKSLDSFLFGISWKKHLFPPFVFCQL